jgi:hypothetical protein
MQSENEPNGRISKMISDIHDTKDLHVCRGYVQPTSLPLGRSTINRAREAGLDQLFQFSTDCLDNFKLIEAYENSYEQQAQILDVVKDLALPILQGYGAPDVEMGNFVSPDTKFFNIVLLSQMHSGIILCTMDENERVIEIRNTPSTEIWRYLHPPSKIIENIISTLIAVAEKHRSKKDEWILVLRRIIDLR